MKEAAKRGLPNLMKTPESLLQLVTPESEKLLETLKIFSEGELKSRFNVRMERYIKTVLIEAETLVSMVNTKILPASFSYRSQLVQTYHSAKEAGFKRLPEQKTIDIVGTLTDKLQDLSIKLENHLDKVSVLEDELECAKKLSVETLKLMDEVRSVSDELEGVIPDELWPLPKYWEMLFLSR